MSCCANAPPDAGGGWARPPDVGKSHRAGAAYIAAAMLMVLAPADAITILWQSANTTISVGQLTYSAVEFENPLTGNEEVLGYRVLEWRDADYDGGPPRWYDDWLVSDSARIDGHPCEIWMRGNGQWIWTTTNVPSGVVSVHLHGDGNDGLASVWVDGAEVARLDMYSSPTQNAVIIVRDLTLGPHTIEVRDQGRGVGGVDVATLGAAVLGFLGEIETKWVQPPEMVQPGQIYGWDEPSIYGGPQLAADDWVCTTDDPVVAVRWWGSFLGWQEQTLPPLPPRAYHLAIWTDVPGMPPDPFSHPGLVLWEAECVPSEVRFAGYDLDPRMPGVPDACFEFYCELPEHLWFHQDPGAHIYWLSIAAIYPPAGCNGDFDGDGDVDPIDLDFFVMCMSGLPDPRCVQADLNGDGVVSFFDIEIMYCQLERGWPDPACCPTPPPPTQPPNPFGWKTRPHLATNPDDAVRIFAPLQPHGGMMFEQGMPIFWPDPAQSWDLSFVLYSRSLEPEGACCVNWTCSLVTSEECARRGGRFLGEGTTCGPPNPCEIRDVVVCEPQGSAGRPFHPPTYWYEVTPGGGFGRCDFHVRVFDPNPANYTNVVMPATWQFAVHQVGADWWASWWDPDCDSAIFNTFQFRFDNPNPSDWGDWTTTISATSDPFDDWIDRSENHIGEPEGFGYLVHVPRPVVTQACCLPDGSCVDVRYADCVRLGGDPQGPGTLCNSGLIVCHPLKWAQPPVYPPDLPSPACFYGWDELSHYACCQILADDFACSDRRPITDIHWWGSYEGWLGQEPPPFGPMMFHIGIWTDVPVDPDNPFSHPGVMLHQWIVPRTALRERWVGCDEFPGRPPESAFRYDFQIPESQWFVQQPGVNIYWLSIAAMYDGPPQPPVWGWKTRPHFFSDDAVVIFDPRAPVPGAPYVAGHPLTDPSGDSWDLAFVITTEGPPPVIDTVVCEPQGVVNNPFHPPTYWYDVTPGGGFGRCDFHVRVLDPNPANYTNVVAPPTWLFAVHQVGADWWASWWDPDCDNAIFATFRFQFDNPNPNDWNHWTTTISSTSDPESQVIDRSEWHAGEPDGLGYRVHVPLRVSPITEACCLRDGSCIDVEAYRCIVDFGGVPQGVGTQCAAGDFCPHAKWTQPPTAAPNMLPPQLFGWNEPSQYGGPQIVADDWYCLDERPVTDIHWWGSYVGWEAGVPPPNAPPRFHIGIWTDVPAMPPLLFSHPGTMIWELVVPRELLHERPVGIDHYPNMPPDTCFQYSLLLPPGMEFMQDPAGQEIYWISIAAIYPGVCNADFDGDGDVDAADLAFFMQCFQGPPTPRCWRADLNGDGLVDLSDLLIFQCQFQAGWPDPACCPPTIPLQWPWGWKTRLPSWNDDGVRVAAPTVPAPGARFRSGTPIFGPEGSWDLAFVLTANLPPLPQACCVQSPAGNFCIEVPAWDCLFRHGGTPQGPGTTCPQVVPAIAIQPRDQDVCERTQVTISVGAQGSPPLAYQWYKDNAPLPGATGPSYVIASADPRDNGRYHVVVSNVCGTIASRQARLTVWLHADANCDGRADNFDIDPFVLAISDPNAWRQQYTCDFLCANDCNGDGRVDNFDIDAFVTCISLGRCP